MDKLRALLPDFSKLSMRERALVIIIGALALALIAMTCISINIRVNMQREYAAVRNGIGESLYSDLYILTQTFDMTGVPNADVQNAILPQMRNYFAAATALNEALEKAYGQRYRLMTNADVSAVNAAFKSYESAFQSGAPTDLARADMQACMNRIRDLLSSRYSEGVLRQAR